MRQEQVLADEALMIEEVERGVRRHVNETSQPLACRTLTRSDRAMQWPGVHRMQDGVYAERGQ